MTALASVPPITQAHPESVTEHGLNESTYYRLWSNDRDDFLSAGAYRNLTGRDRGPVQTIANGTDLPADAPPEVVEYWNDAEHAAFPKSGTDVSLAPDGVSLEDRRFIKDAFIEIFAIQPSSRARITNGEHPLYVPRNGSVLGVSDYRIVVPEPRGHGDGAVSWSISSARISEVRLLIDGTLIDSTPEGRTPRLSYTRLDAFDGERHEVTLEADIAVRMKKRVRDVDRHCRVVGEVRSCWVDVDYHVSYEHEQLTVSDSIAVIDYHLAVSGWKTRYPNGDLGLVVYKNHPWRGYSMPDGDVNGVWRFYTARDLDWDTLSRHTASGVTSVHSPAHPMQVVAYPIKTGPTASPRERVTILEAFGEQTEPDSLPPNVHLDALTEPYIASYGIASRVKTTNHDLRGVTASGLVRGVEVVPEERHFIDVPFNQSSLRLQIQNETAQEVTVRVTLTDNATESPIGTDSREGYVVVGGQRVNTTRDGTAVVTIPKPLGSVSATYEPGWWWRTYPAYSGDSAVVTLSGGTTGYLNVLYRISIPISLFLIAVFFIDRITQWRLWPPWRNL